MNLEFQIDARQIYVCSSGLVRSQSSNDRDQNVTESAGISVDSAGKGGPKHARS